MKLVVDFPSGESVRFITLISRQELPDVRLHYGHFSGISGVLWRLSRTECADIFVTWAPTAHMVTLRWFAVSVARVAVPAIGRTTGIGHLLVSFASDRDRRTVAPSVPTRNASAQARISRVGDAAIDRLFSLTAVFGEDSADWGGAGDREFMRCRVIRFVG